MWATGIIMYSLVSGAHPFYNPGDGAEDFIKKSKNFRVSFTQSFSE